jgi:hypothetical protein
VQTPRSIASVAAAVLLASVHGHAASLIALDFTNAFERVPIAQSNYGWAFTVTAPIMVDGLGLWDAGSNGLIEPHAVGLWRTSGPIGVPVLIASEEVNNDSVPIDSTSPNGRWLFSSIPPVTLEPGNYIVGGLYLAGAQDLYDPFVSDALSIATLPGVEYGSTREVHGTDMLTCPTDFGLNEHNGFFGPNVRIVPEPSVFTLLIASAALFLRRGRYGGCAEG